MTYEARGCHTYTFELSQRLGTGSLVAGERLEVGDDGQCAVGISAVAIESADLASYFRREGRVLHMLHNRRHPNFPKLQDTVEGPDGRSFIIMDPLGQDLDSYVRGKGGLEEAEARMIFRQLASGIAHCHRNSIVLRDIALRKMFFSDASCTTLLLADLDGAEVMTASNRNRIELLTSHPKRTIGGLPREQKGAGSSISPEALSCVPYDGRAADMWALGVVLLRLLSGTSLRTDERDTPRAHNHVLRAAEVLTPSTPSPSWPVGAPLSAQHLLRRLLDLNPRNRPTADELLNEEWLCTVPRLGELQMLRRRSSLSSLSDLDETSLQEAADRQLAAANTMTKLSSRQKQVNDALDQVVPGSVVTSLRRCPASGKRSAGTKRPSAPSRDSGARHHRHKSAT